jgi:hypothetical protein
MPMRIVLLLLFLWLPTAVSAQESVGMWYVQPGGEAIASGISSGPVPNLPGRGYFHLTNTLTLSRKVPQPGVRVTALGAYELYWDGVRIGSSGRVGRSAEEEVPGPMTACFPLPDSLAQPGTHALALRISNYLLPKGASWFVVSEGTYTDLITRPFLPALAMHTLAGLFLAAALYFLFVANRSDRSYALFSGICGLFFALIVLEYLRAYYFYPYTFQYLRLDLIQWLTLALCVLIPVFFAVTLLPEKGRYILIGQLALLALLVYRFYGQYDRLAIAGATTMLLTSTGIAAIAAVRSGPARWVLGSLVLAGISAVLFPFDYSLFLGFGLVILVQFFLLSRRMKDQRRAVEEARLLSARLQTELLKKQIQPHYLLNTLTCLAEFVEESPEKGVALIFALSREFSLFFRFVQEKQVPIREEIELCRRHLEVMQLRLEATYSWSEEGILPAETIPPAVLHTLVENGLTHCRPVDGFHLSFRKKNGIREYILITRGHPAHAFEQEGTGTRYLKARLTESYGERWSFHSGPSPEGWENRIQLHENTDRRR